MEQRRNLPVALAAPVVVAAALGSAFAWQRLRSAPLPPAARPLPALVEHCQRAAELLYQVHWAAACFQSRDSNDCMLPEAQAARVNAVLVAEEARCMAAEAQASAGSWPRAARRAGATLARPIFGNRRAGQRRMRESR